MLGFGCCSMAYRTRPLTAEEQSLILQALFSLRDRARQQCLGQVNEPWLDRYVAIKRLLSLLQHDGATVAVRFSDHGITKPKGKAEWRVE